MGVSMIALYANPPCSVCNTPYPSLINSQASSDCESSSSATSVQKPIIGGLSCLLSSPSLRHSSSFFGRGDEFGSMWHDRGEELSSSFTHSPYSSLSSSLKCKDQSPVSIFQGPVSCCSSGMFNGFVRNALGSCLPYDSRSIPMPGGGLDRDSSVPAVDEFTFNLEDNFADTCCDPHVKELLFGAQLRHKIFYDDIIVKAFYEAEKAHRGQMRVSGDRYLQHCIETAILLASVGATSTVVAAGLLHDTLDDSFMTYHHILRTFGVGVADLVEGVSKLSQLSQLARDNNTANKTVEADRLHTMFLAMADARAVLIKLADRLHNMMTLEALPLFKQLRFAKETLKIFAPLANRLGILTWKEQLENLCFKYLNPDQHEELSSRLLKSFDDEMITSSIEKLKRGLEDRAVPYHFLSGRHKSLYSIYCKMLKKNLTMDEIHDVYGIRLIVENEEACYTALRIVHQLWSEVPGKFKDYIVNPKFNGYQSLHSVVMVDHRVALEVQIRTKEMHLQAEYGFAAHWRYKEGDRKYSLFVLQMVEWARWVVTWQSETMSKDQTSSHVDSHPIKPWRSSHFNSHPIKPPCPFPSHRDDCPYSYVPTCGEDEPVFVIMVENNKMSVQEFPANSTVMDLLERAGWGSSRLYPHGSPVKEELRAKLNHEPVTDPSLKLKMGDAVELIPFMPDKSLTEYREGIRRMYDEYREEIRRMYDQEMFVSSIGVASSSHWRS